MMKGENGFSSFMVVECEALEACGSLVGIDGQL